MQALYLLALEGVAETNADPNSYGFRPERFTAEAITATAHKLGRLIYRLIKHGENYVRQGLEDYERKFQERKMHGLKKAAMMMGFDLVPKQATTPAVS